MNEDVAAIMIDGKEYKPVCASSDVFHKKGMCVEVDEFTSLALFRIDNVCYAVTNVCPHQHQPVISVGVLEGKNITCPMHGWQFDITTGVPAEGNKGTATLHTFPVVERDGVVYVHIGTPKIPKWMLE